MDRDRNEDEHGTTAPAADAASDAAYARHETALERDDRNFVELLQELRVTQTGVQILFAFLLTLAFTQRFTELDSLQRGTYVTTLLLSVAAAVLLTAPAAVHRGCSGGTRSAASSTSPRDWRPRVSACWRSR